MEIIINYLSNVPWYWILGFALFITFLENIFPPAPCDTALLFCGSLVGLGAVDFVPLLIFSTAGSMIGFILIFRIGRTLGLRIVGSHRFPFINKENIKKPQEWFEKYGNAIIIINRFMSGTRAVISFVAGMSKMPYSLALILSGVSALLWNTILILLGMFFGANWRHAEYYITMYGKFIFPLIFLVIIVLIAIKYYKKKKAKNTV
jgi:membrane protein DedA with SNARE-associated domain